MRRGPTRTTGPWMLFRDREAAGSALAHRLERYRGSDALVLGIPRGGVPVAAAVARHLAAELDIIVARKLGAPFSAELAIGAITADGGRFLNDEMIRELGVTDRYLAQVTAEEQAEARRRETRFRAGRPPLTVAGRTVIVVDDGLATGATMHAAVRSLRSQRPARLVVAVPVGSREACAALHEEADEVLCLHRPDPFFAVGLYYEHFNPTEDAEVLRILEDVSASRMSTVPAPSPHG